MKKIISLFLLMFLLAINFSYADIHPTDANLPTFRLILKNDVQVTSKIYKFEIWISSVSSNVLLNLRQWQAGISYNTAIMNGGTITGTLDYTGSILLQFSDMYPQSINTATAGAVKIAAKLGAMTSYIPISNDGTEYKLVTVTLTNTNDFAQAKANLGWLFTSSPYPTKVFAYLSSTTPNAQVTMPNNNPGTVIQSWHSTNQLTNPTLNAPTGPTVQNVTGGGSYCEGTTPTGVSVGLAGSETGYNYQLYKDAVAYGTAVAGTGNPLTWNNLPAGLYTVKSGTTDMNGSATVTEIPLPVAPTVGVVDACGQSTLTASNYTGSLLWSTSEATQSIVVTQAGNYTVTQTVNGCTSLPGSGNAAPIAIPAAPQVSVMDNCGNSELTASNFTGTLLWSTSETTQSIVVTQAGNYTVTQTLNGCTSLPGSGNAAPIAIPNAPTVNVVDACGMSTLTASNYTGTLTWSTLETTASINVTSAGQYTVYQTVSGCNSTTAQANANPIDIPVAPVVNVVDACGQSTLTASNYAGTLLWSTNETTGSIVVTQAGNYTVTQTVNGCTSAAASGNAAPNAVPAAPTVDVVDACGQSTLTASNYTGTLLWSTNETTASIVVTQAGNYTVTQTVNGCTSLPGSGNAAPLQIFNQTVTIQASANPSVIGNPVTYTASAVPAASNQIFDWYINNVWQNTNGDNTFTYTPVNGDIITCSAVPVGCYTGGNSNSITQIVGPAGPVTNTWLGGNNDWHQASNWSQGIVPMNNHNVVIPIVAMWYPIINQPAVCNNLTIESGAQLINNSTLAIGGTVKVKQALTSGQWHFISSPINNATAYSFSLANPNNIGQTLYLQKYNEAWEMLPGNSPWVDITTGWQEVMSAGKGYEVWSDNNHTVVFEGTILNKDNVSAPVNYTPTATFPGYNLIGNPYPSGLDIHGFNTWGNNMDASIWVWDGSQYLFQNSMFGNLGWYIAPKQAFMVKANNVAPSFVIPATAKSFSGTFLKSTVADLLKLQVNGNNYSDAAYINFNSNATNDYDGQFDVEKLFGIEAAPQLYSTITGKNLSINTLPSLNGNVVVPMSLKVGANGTYTINASEMNSFASGTSIYLEDLKTGSFTNLKQQPVYTFTANVSDNSDRFRIHFAAPNGIAENGNGNIRIYSNDNVIYVNNLANENIKEIVVMNVLGQQLLSKQSVNRTLNTITMDVASAYYVVKVVTENKVYTQKVYVR